MPGEAGDEQAGTPRALPITVIGGYLGAGKTTLLNSILSQSGERRIGVVVNDFGEMGIDASTITASGGAADVINLPNGCVCCTLGDDLRETLEMLRSIDPPLDDIVIEASGVADPAATAAWGTVAPFVSGGIVVLAAADTIRARLRDRYVGGEVRRQLERAHLVLLTKTDRCSQTAITEAHATVTGITASPIVEANRGEIDVDLVLGSIANRSTTASSTSSVSSMSSVSSVSSMSSTSQPHGLDRYVRWSREASSPIEPGRLDEFLAALPDGILRLKGWVELANRNGGAFVNVVGSSVDVAERSGDRAGSRLEAIGIAEMLDTDALDALAATHLGPAPT